MSGPNEADIRGAVYTHCQVHVSRRYLLENPFASDSERMAWAENGCQQYFGGQQSKEGMRDVQPITLSDREKKAVSEHAHVRYVCMPMQTHL
jgi:hypothetical protein